MNSETRIYTTVARDRIVEEGDPEAAFLVTGAGGEVPAEYAGMYREYRKAHEADAEPDGEADAQGAAKAEPAAVAEAETAAEAKAVDEPPENKARGRSGAK